MVIHVAGLVKRYGSLQALDHLDLDVEEGEVFGLLGPNGSGKTTAIHCMLALLRYDRGTVELFGRRMTPDAYDIKRQIGVIMQNVAVFNELTVEENIGYFCGLYVSDSRRRRQLVDKAVEFAGLGDYRRFYPKKLSGGLLRRLNIACGIAHRPRLIFLDEPTVAVDPQSRHNILEGIRQLNREGATVVYTSHYMEEVEQICTRIAIMDKGRIVATGTNDELKGMVRIGEKITAEVHGALPPLAAGIAALPGVASAGLEKGQLVVTSERGRNNLTAVFEFLRAEHIAYGRILCELPTLNDVFLEITGKQLRE